MGKQPKDTAVVGRLRSFNLNAHHRQLQTGARQGSWTGSSMLHLVLSVPCGFADLV